MVLDITSKTQSFGRGCFESCTSIQKFDIDTTNITLTLGESCFRYCTSISSVKMTGMNLNIPPYAFYNNTALTSIEMQAKSSISLSTGSFQYDIALKSVVLTSNSVSVGNNALSNCIDLSAISFTSDSLSIGSFAFLNCTSLPSTKFNASSFYLYASAFVGSTLFKELNVSATYIYMNQVSYWDSEKSRCSIEYMNLDTSIGWERSYVYFNEKFFYGVSSLKELKVLTKTMEIYNNSFNGAINLTSISLTIDTLTARGNAFGNC